MKSNRGGGLLSILSLFRNELKKFNYIGALMLNYFHMALKLL